MKTTDPNDTKNVLQRVDRILRAGGGHIQKLYLGEWWLRKMMLSFFYMPGTSTNPLGQLIADRELDRVPMYQGVPIEKADGRFEIDVEG